MTSGRIPTARRAARENPLPIRNKVTANSRCAPAVTGTYTNISGATSPYTNTIAGGKRFFRLIAN